jgi:hypothetical protein
MPRNAPWWTEECQLAKLEVLPQQGRRLGSAHHQNHRNVTNFEEDMYKLAMCYKPGTDSSTTSCHNERTPEVPNFMQGCERMSLRV